MATGPNKTTGEPSGEYLMINRPGVPLIKASEIKTLEDFGRVALMLAEGLPAPVRNDNAAATQIKADRSYVRMRAGAAGSVTLNVVLTVALGAMALYYRGYDRGAADSKIEVTEPSVVPVPVPTPTSIATSDDVALVEMRAVVVALSVLQAEQQDYLASVLAAQAARKKPPTKPESLIKAEAEIQKLSKR